MMKFTVKILFSLVLIFAPTNFAFGQTVATPVDLETILKKSAEQTANS